MYLKTHELIQEQEVCFVKKGHSQSHFGVVDDLIYNNGDCTAVVRIGRIKVEINDNFIIFDNNLKSVEG
ncbi:hypothetical protein [Staphylococcus equorum]|uniref:hypothetical protein n=1 Tax=Staphylococcus equorum TaxID=246432 RepID=UPI002554F1CD|nr:hypothetical protein [Staphylococcus equorum]MDK9853846.1 hypothetical protein [Staphylococcus equorum]